VFAFQSADFCSSGAQPIGQPLAWLGVQQRFHADWESNQSLWAPWTAKEAAGAGVFIRNRVRYRFQSGVCSLIQAAWWLPNGRLWWWPDESGLVKPRDGCRRRRSN